MTDKQRICSLGYFECVDGGYWYIGDKVRRVKEGVCLRRGTVSGFAVGKDGRACLVLDGKNTYMCPVEEAFPDETVQDVIFALMIELTGDVLSLNPDEIDTYAERMRAAVRCGA